jgi:hypothetical protein
MLQAALLAPHYGEQALSDVIRTVGCGRNPVSNRTVGYAEVRSNGRLPAFAVKRFPYSPQQLKISMVLHLSGILGRKNYQTKCFSHFPTTV